MSATNLAQSAYAPTAAPIRTDRGTEYAAFQRVTAMLARAASTKSTTAMRAEAVHENRRLWTILATDLATPGNELPQTLRAQMFYLAEFSLLQSRKALGEKAHLQPLIDINRAVMRGLDGNAEVS